MTPEREVELMNSGRYAEYQVETNMFEGAKLITDNTYDILMARYGKEKADKIQAFCECELGLCIQPITLTGILNLINHTPCVYIPGNV